MKTNSDHPQPLILPLGAGKGYHINFDQTQVQIEDETGSRTSYNYTTAFVKSLDREEVINALIRTRYSASEELAIHRKHAANEPGAAAEFEEYNNFVNYCKNLV